MTTIAAPMDVAQAYFAAWNRRDPEGIVSTFMPGGTYSDPAAGEGLTGAAIAAYAAGLFTAFPYHGFELVDARIETYRLVVAEWTMRGTNRGPLQGGPPTGGTVTVHGIDVIRVQDGGIASVHGYFDRQTLLQQLGLQVLVLPFRAGPVSVREGTARRARSAPRPPRRRSAMRRIPRESRETRPRSDRP